MRVMTRWISTAVLALMMAAQAYPAPQGRGRGRHKEAVVTAFAPSDRVVIGDYYRAGRGLPPGLARRNGDLPPGLEKQLRRNGALPPGLERRFAPFPAEIESRLPPCPPDVRRGTIGGVAVMYNSRTGLIVDAFAIVSR